MCEILLSFTAVANEHGVFILIDLAGARSAGAVVGVTIGCLMGMVPLLFLEHAQKDPQPNQTKAAEDE